MRRNGFPQLPWNQIPIAPGFLRGLNRLDMAERGQHLPIVRVAWQSVFKKLKKVRGLSEHERILFARSLAATPDERWQMHETFLRSHGLYKHSQRRTFGFRSTPNIGGP